MNIKRIHDLIVFDSNPLIQYIIGYNIINNNSNAMLPLSIVISIEIIPL